MTTDGAIARPLTGSGESDEEAAGTSVQRSAIGMLRAEQATIRQAAVGAVFSGGDVSLRQGGGRAFVAAGDMRIEQGGGGMLLAGGDVAISQGGAGTIVTLGSARIQMGGSVVMVAGNVDVGAQGTVGLALAPRLTVQPGGKVIVGLREAAAAGVIAGVLAGIIAAVAARLGGRR
jgi:hypothetical protein